jgi:hypothetical protein
MVGETSCKIKKISLENLDWLLGICLFIQHFQSSSDLFHHVKNIIDPENIFFISVFLWNNSEIDLMKENDNAILWEDIFTKEIRNNGGEFHLIKEINYILKKQ